MSRQRISERARYLAAMRLLDAPRWRVEVRTALVAAGSITDAATTLGVGRRTLCDWIESEPTLTRDIALRKPGRPRQIRPVATGTPGPGVTTAVSDGGRGRGCRAARRTTRTG